VREDGLWRAELRDSVTGERGAVAARALVNAGGPWASQILHRRLGDNRGSDLRLVKGSHIVVRRLFDHDHAYIFQNPDRRIVFAIPYEADFTLIGTTEVDYLDDLDKVHITGDETAYLCESINRYFRRKITPDDVVWSYSGVRPLHDDVTESASAATREYVLELDAPADRAPLLNVLGGKITIYRKLSEQALDRLGPGLGFGPGAWTEGVPLPGGDMANADFEGFLADSRRRYPWLPEALARRYARAYGTRMERLLDGAERQEDLGADLGGGLHEAEVDYLASVEWARSADDILWRRSKLGLHVPPGTAERVERRLDRAVEPEAGLAKRAGVQ
jgi:glycerol-3-phosphate dehydrogenase